ncbi:MAG: GNAT family N-acetyltransferase [Sphingobium sp.]|nr:GNAT family N-acetyltransferase [Sphingobium sp.]
MPVVARPATRADVAAIHRRLQHFGAHIGHPEWVSATPGRLDAALFGPAPQGHAHVATLDDRVVGVALWFLTFNFWMAQPILYLEDLFVDAEARGAGAGEALMQALAAEACARDCAWMDWIVLTDNLGGQRFYERIGARLQPEWRLWRLEGEALAALAGERPD